MKKHGHYEHEIPADPAELYHWVRFEGEHYVPKKAKKSTITPKSTDKRYEQVDYPEWTSLLSRSLEGVQKLGGQGHFSYEAPATEAELKEVEAALGCAIPPAFRQVLLQFSRKVRFHWSVYPKELVLNDAEKLASKNEDTADEAASLTGNVTRNVSKDLTGNVSKDVTADVTRNVDGRKRMIASGGYPDDGLWDLAKLAEYQAAGQDIDYDEDAGERGHGTDFMIFCNHGNGDYFAIDLCENPGEVIYLSHEGDWQGLRLGLTFASFIDNWVRIGCAGHFAEDFRLLSAPGQPYLDHCSPNSVRIQEALGI